MKMCFFGRQKPWRAFGPSEIEDFWGPATLLLWHRTALAVLSLRASEIPSPRACRGCRPVCLRPTPSNPLVAAPSEMNDFWGPETPRSFLRDLRGHGILTNWRTIASGPAAAPAGLRAPASLRGLAERKKPSEARFSSRPVPHVN